MPPHLLIIADDLTGANDAGVQFARQGIKTLVSISPETPLTKFAEQCEVLVVNTESRHIEPNAAYACVYNIAVQGVALGIPHFYKKTDSTLRGNIGSELAAILDATKATELFFAPAYPKLNRTTENGIQLVNGIPIQQTSFAADPLNPMNESFLPAIIGVQTNLPVKVFDKQPANSAHGIWVVNAATDADLRAHAQWLQRRERTTLLAGSAGWAEFLPEIFSFNHSLSPAPKLSKPILIVNGSLHENSLRQVAFAAQQGIPVIDAQRHDATQQVYEGLAINAVAILTTNANAKQNNAAENLANITGQILAQTNVHTLIVFGGDTLAAIAHNQHWYAFRPRTEIFTGIPVVEICERENLLLVTKAGGFGAEDILMKLNY